MVIPGKTGSAVTMAEDHVGIVDVNGVIAPDQDASADLIVTGLTRAFEAENTTAVLLKINSPGGSPVQSNQVYNAIKRLRAVPGKEGVRGNYRCGRLWGVLYRLRCG